MSRVQIYCGGESVCVGAGERDSRFSLGIAEYRGIGPRAACVPMRAVIALRDRLRADSSGDSIEAQCRGDRSGMHVHPPRIGLAAF